MQPIIFFGDNGSGKSSIVDALEFGLRGRLSRRGLGGEKQRREVRNLVASGPPGVLLTLQDGSRIRRGGGILDSSPERGAEVVAGFEFCPVVIRRHDVESFWAIPSGQRQDFFFDYLRDPGAAARAQERAALEKSRSLAESQVRTARRELLPLINGDSRLPDHHIATQRYFKRTLLPQYAEFVGGKRTVPSRLYKAFRRYQDALQRAERLGRASRSDLVEELPDAKLRAVLEAISDRVTSQFAKVAGKEWVTGVRMSLDDSARLDIALELVNGRAADPTQVLNEAALDVLALLILVEVHIECASLGQEKLIVLDDVFQSVDSVHRVRSLEHVLSRLRGWQVFLTLHDRLWLELARNTIQRVGPAARVIEVRATSHAQPPLLITNGNSTIDELELLLESDVSPGLLVGASGRALEQLADRLSASIGTSVTRRKEDKYTLADLWPGVSKALSKIVDRPNLVSAVVTLNQSQALRNIAGAHYNEWADSLSRQEAVDFLEATVQIWREASCPYCGSVISTFRPPQGSRTLLELPCKC